MSTRILRSGSASGSSASSSSSSGSLLKVYHVLIIYVLGSTSGCAYLHFSEHGKHSIPQLALAFFLCLNALICLWEIALGWHIDHIKKESVRLEKAFKGDRLKACMSFFNADISLSEIFSLQFWSIVWSTYALYDPSYANKESFGFFIDVGNGWTTIIPSIFFCLGLTYEWVPARILGMIGLVKFYQEFYGTIIYFLSFFLNKRYKGVSVFEVLLFIGFSNGIWFFFPLYGMWTSVQMILTDSYQIFR
jgi:hypothetical protein